MAPRPLFAVLLALAAALPAGAESFKSWAARGNREEREKDFKGALSSYSNALSQWKEGDSAAAKAKVLCARAGLREKDGDDAAAIADYSDCLAIDKKNPKSFHKRGLLYLKAGKTSPAIGDFYKAVALDIGFGQAYFDRARAYESQGEMEFAGEDYRHACDLGVKAACPKSKALNKKSPGKRKKKAAEKAAVPDTPAEEAAALTPADPDEDAADKEPAESKPETKAAPKPAPEPEPEPEAAPARKKKAKAELPYYRPKFRDCLDAMDACVERGDSFGACVRKAPNCDAKAVKGCCPAACLKAYQKSINRDRSEAEAFRENFAVDSACGIPPKAEEDD